MARCAGQSSSACRHSLTCAQRAPEQRGTRITSEEARSTSDLFASLHDSVLYEPRRPVFWAAGVVVPRGTSQKPPSGTVAHGCPECRGAIRQGPASSDVIRFPPLFRGSL